MWIMSIVLCLSGNAKGLKREPMLIITGSNITETSTMPWKLFLYQVTEPRVTIFLSFKFIYEH